MAIQPDFSKSAFNDRPHRPRLSSHPATEHSRLSRDPSGSGPCGSGPSRSSQDYDPFQDHAGAEGVSLPSPEAPNPYKTCCTCSGLGMVEVNNGVGGYWEEFCPDCAAGIELEAQDAADEMAWSRECAA